MTAAPESLPELALAFACEVLGWEDARLDNVRNSVPYVFNMARGEFDNLPFTDLNAVIRAAMLWCQAKRVSLEFYWLYTTKKYHAAIIGKTCHNPSVSNSSDAGYAIMAACVAAARHLKGGG